MEHNFQTHTFFAPTDCAQCKKFIWGIILQGKECKQCNLSVHAKCAKLIKRPCESNKDSHRRNLSHNSSSHARKNSLSSSSSSSHNKEVISSENHPIHLKFSQNTDLSTTHRQFNSIIKQGTIDETFLKKLISLPVYDNPEPAKAFHENASSEEIIDYIIHKSEWYTEILEEIVANWLAPLSYISENPSSLFPSFDISSSDLSRIFSNIELVFFKELDLLSDLKAHEELNIKKIAEIFADHVEHLGVYQAYTKAYPAICSLISRNSKILQHHEDMRGIKLDKLLSYPLQRTKFFVEQFKILSGIASFTDREIIENVLKSLETLKQNCANILTTSKHRIVVKEISKSIDGYPDELYDPLRELIRQGEFEVQDDQTKKYFTYHYFLFNDLLVWTLPKKHHFIFKEQVNLERATLLDPESEVSTSFLGNDKKISIFRKKKAKILPCSLKILQDGGEIQSIKWKTSSREEKDSLLKNLNQVILKWYRQRVFGIPLFDILARENQSSEDYDPIPKCLRALVDYFKDESRIKVEGIFRVSPSKTQIKAFKSEIDHGGNLRFLKTSTPFIVADLIKIFFREMPDSLLTFELYDEFVESVDTDNEKKENIQNAIEKLPEYRKDLLKYMIIFLQRVASFSEFNRMNSRNLALLFEPNFLRQDPSKKFTLNISTMGNLVDTLIKDNSILFPFEIENLSSFGFESNPQKAKTLKRDLENNRNQFFESALKIEENQNEEDEEN